MEHKNHSIEKENPLPNLHFLGSMLIFRGVGVFFGWGLSYPLRSEQFLFPVSLMPGALAYTEVNPTVFKKQSEIVQCIPRHLASLTPRKLNIELVI